MTTTLPIEILYLLEEKIGKEEAKKVSSAIIASLDVIESKANDIALQKKLELKDELTKELATKADLNLVEVRLNAKIDLVKTELNAKITLYFVILLCAIFLSNPSAINLISKILGLAK
jgi:hypothetical protein